MKWGELRETLTRCGAVVWHRTKVRVRVGLVGGKNSFFVRIFQKLSKEQVRGEVLYEIYRVVGCDLILSCWCFS